jgi:hypothetical protein
MHPSAEKDAKSLQAVLIVRNQYELKNPMLQGDQVRSIIRLTLD